MADEWGRGSSRAHADLQIYATRWDLLPHENGFPANRQFYLLKKGRQFFYSAAPPEHAKVTTHAANRTIIRYELPGGLEVERSLFVLSAEDGLPLGVEAQLIRVTNRGETPRRLDIIVTEMFGFPYPAALHVDVLYTCITVESGVCHPVGSLPLLVAPRYAAGWGTEDRPFHLSQVVKEDGMVVYPTEFCLAYRRFIGRGTLEHPEMVAVLDNRFPAKGPAFFALKLPLKIGAGGMTECQSFTGLVSQHEGESVTDETLLKRLNDFANHATDPDWTH